MLEMLKRYKFLFILSVLVIAIFFGLLILTSIERDDSPTPLNGVTPTQTPLGSSGNPITTLSPLQKTIIGTTTRQEIEQMPQITRTPISENTDQYNFSSEYVSRPNIIITENDLAAFERIVTSEKSSSPGFSRISELMNKFGQPEETITGSTHYGRFVNTYIYANKGFAIIGNPYTDEVYEIQQFTPMSVENYRSKYGQDINPNQDSHEEVFN